MLPALASILQRSKAKSTYNILSYPTHERYQSNLAKTGHNFYLLHANGVKTWNSLFAIPPKNHTLLNGSLGVRQIPPYLGFDFILCQSNGYQMQMSKEISSVYQLPIISLEHTTPMPEYSPEQLHNIKRMTKSNINVFISDYNRSEWRYGEDEAEIVHHCIDDAVFNPGDWPDRKPHILTVANEYISRDYALGFQIYKRVTQGLPCFPVGDTKGLSKAAKDVEELAGFYRTSQVFLNTSTHSPIPMSLLEAMACGCAVVSTKTCMIPEIIEHGVNGLMTNDETEMRGMLVSLLQNPALARKLGEEAVKTIQRKFGVQKFISRWNEVFDLAVGLKFPEPV